MTNFGRLSMSAYKNSARNTGKHSRNRRPTECRFIGMVRGVSSSVSGNVKNRKLAAAATAIAMEAMPKSPVTISRIVKSKNPASDLMESDYVYLSVYDDREEVAEAFEQGSGGAGRGRGKAENVHGRYLYCPLDGGATVW